MANALLVDMDFDRYGKVKCWKKGVYMIVISNEESI